MCSLNQIVAEARQLMTRLHDREKLADEAVARGQSLQEKISSMKEVRSFPAISHLLASLSTRKKWRN